MVSFVRKYIFAILIVLNTVLLGVQTMVQDKPVFSGFGTGVEALAAGDFNAYYFGGKLFLHNESLYDVSSQSIVFPNVVLSESKFPRTQKVWNWINRSVYGATVPEVTVPSVNIFVYPPLMAVLFVPISMLPFVDAYILTSIFSLTVFAFAVYMLSAKLPRRRMFLIFAVVAFLTSFIFAVHLHRGQTDMLIASLVIFGYLALQQRKSNVAGVLIGVASLLKLTPIVLVPYLMFRDRRAFWFASGTLGACLFLIPADIWFAFLERITSFATSFSSGTASNGLFGLMYNSFTENFVSYAAAKNIYAVVSFVLLCGVAAALFPVRKKTEQTLLIFAVLTVLMMLLPGVSWVYNGVYVLIVFAAYWSIRFHTLVSAWVYFVYDIFAYLILSSYLLLSYARDYPVYHMFALRPLFLLCFLGLFLYVMRKEFFSRIGRKIFTFGIQKFLAHRRRFSKFAFVGAVGVITNLFIFSILHQTLLLDVNSSAVLAFFGAVTQNYLINHSWTFSFQEIENHTLKGYGKYVFANLLGLGVNLLVLNVIVRMGFLPLAGQVLGVGAGMVCNYVTASKFVFRRT
ncbi:hypothetical protein A3C89_01690 [Candidatus Kaiserbacteria bacterium RIFCSPHIGHO2_02_FULL_50_50]|uniref:GtrA/DPMS transmembrane domain-containing protein n=1 Tax=Candidatus Kaiserbacteria bacterium RIFCSPHIGHO2_02_FULL_50_50 TaxID=1798492 RepID=A0A1F6DDI7_9BACT|nr:MAG: hypothetical protein A3C89_01690 [Candidatus Kaiserbacteria bacterium RIFCSPHIGHO2_02_FULL_50_50]OGG88296.1 MAG: hypothetical protein A3G62_03300 [Candidatus Kaiserbacteria bacterium RIFCSPLOWO2_12_FULL_50_10]